MPVSVDQFAKAIVASGLLSADEVKSLWGALPSAGRPKDGETFAALLIKNGKLTEFQAEELLGGSGTPLVLGDYMLLAKIGAGGMGQVFKGRHRHMERLVAIKLLPAAVTKDEAAVKRFQREVKAAAKLSHPNIVEAHDASVQRGVWYLVMEYVEGRDLSAIVKDRGPLPVHKAVYYILQAAQGLEYAHSQGVIHRDIKPANLLLNKNELVKILDMGLARFDQSDGGADTELTGTGTIMGTVDYMSPEQAINTKHADERSDVYSLGISLYYLLSGKPAYPGETAMEKLLAHRTQPIPSLQEVQTTVPKQLDDVFKKMVAKVAADRYRSMGEVVEALEGLGFGGSSRVANNEAAGAVTLSVADRKKLGKQQASASVLTRVVKSEKSRAFAAKLIGGAFVTIVAPIFVTFLIRYLDKADGPQANHVPPPANAAPSVAHAPADSASVSPLPPAVTAVATSKPTAQPDATTQVAVSSVDVPPSGDSETLSSTGPTRAGIPTDAPPPAVAPFDAAQVRVHQESWAKHLGTQISTTNSVGMKMVLIPPGEFLMGSTDEQVEAALKVAEEVGADEPLKSRIRTAERPQHRVVLTRPFRMSATEVTIGQFRKFIEATGYVTEAGKAARQDANAKTYLNSDYAATDDSPAEMITWNDAVAFCAWLTEQEASPLKYRLPTEAEWEYACRAGTTMQYSFGDDYTQLGDHAWYGKNSGEKSHPVGKKLPNPFGLYDMLGNVREWCGDWFDANFYVASPLSDPTGPSAGTSRVIRGGNWESPVSYCRSASRHSITVSNRNNRYGFRCVSVW